MNRLKHLAYSLSLVVLTSMTSGCGGGSDGEGSAGSEGSAKGFFVDSAVSNLNYSSKSYSGTTGGNGDFEHEPGETTTFSYLGLTLGSITTSSSTVIVTPFDIYSTSNFDDQRVKNALVLLQSIDEDQNPSNGIRLLEKTDGQTFPDLTSLDISAPDFQSKLQTKLSNAGATKNISLVSEDSAKEHFQEQEEKRQNLSAKLFGTWLLRDGMYGDISAKYVFKNDGTVAIEEFDGCPSNYWAASETATRRNCKDITNLTLNWSQSDAALTMSDASIEDKCTITSATALRIEASCEFTGSGEGQEFIYFERTFSTLSEQLVQQQYREVETGALSFTNLIFNNGASSKTGSYKYFNENAEHTVGNGDAGNFTWAVSTSQISYAGTDDSQANFSDSCDFNGKQIDGALVCGSAVSTVMIPSFDSRVASSYIRQTYLAIYDAVDGKCNALYAIDSTPDTSPRALRKEQTRSSNTDICQLPSEATVPSLQDQDVHQMTVQNGAFVIEKADEREVCWPIRFTGLSDTTNYLTVACSTNNATSHELQIWRAL